MRITGLCASEVSIYNLIPLDHNLMTLVAVRQVDTTKTSQCSRRKTLYGCAPLMYVSGR